MQDRPCQGYSIRGNGVGVDLASKTGHQGSSEVAYACIDVLVSFCDFELRRASVDLPSSRVRSKALSKHKTASLEISGSKARIGNQFRLRQSSWKPMRGQIIQ